MNPEFRIPEIEIAALESHILSVLPRAEHFPKEQVTPTLFYPKNFDEILAARDELQSFKLAIPRAPQIQKMYDDTRSQPDKLKEETGMDIFEKTIAYILNQQSTAITQLYFPYQMPTDESGNELAHHNIMWYKNDVTPRERARAYAESFYKEGISKNDFVIVQNPPFARSIPRFEHNHIFVRAKPTYQFYGKKPNF